ncbi:hypothetical protein MUP46_00740 [Patescibacteria group bacterium]|nr:hypothetical protein [Patescibacteria group bacterium]
MKPLSVIAVIAGLIVLCGAGSVPCFADTGSGVSIELTTTVTGGNSGSGWASGGINWQYVDNQPRKVSPYVPPPVTNSYPPTPPTPPTYPTVTQTTPSPTVNPPVISTQSIDWVMILIITGLVGAIGLLIFVVVRMRRKPEAVNPIDN